MVNHFITAIYVYFEKKDDSVIMHYSNGGHPPIIVYRAETNHTEIIEVKGTILGMFSDVLYKKKEIVLHKGDCVFIYTDGLPETIDRKGEIIGYDNLSNIICECISEDLKETISNIRNSIESYSEGVPPEDDLLIIRIKVK